MNLADLIASHARNRPLDPAVMHGASTLSYAELDRRVSGFAARLHQCGVAAGTVVGLCLSDSVDHLIMHFAVARLGAVILPMDHRWTQAEKVDVARVFGARFVLLEPGAEELPGLQCLYPESGWPESPLPALPSPPRSAAQPLLISLSSGTTGRPKGAVVTHGQMYERFVNQWVTLSLNASDRFVSVTPLYFGAARSFCMSVLAAGAVVILAPPPHRPGQLAAAISSTGASVCFVVPTQMRRLLADAAPGGGLLFPDLRLLIFGGSIVAGDEAARIRGRLTANLASYYATSEGGGISVLQPREFPEHGDSVGRASFRVDVEVVDATGRTLPHDEVGQLRFRGPGVATVFLDEDGRQQHSAGGGWFYPGDLASIDAEGYISLRGREKDMIIRGGINVYPAEIERVLSEHPAIREVGVTGAPSPVHGEVVVAFVVAASPVAAEDLLSWCRQRLAPYKVPAEILFLAELPKTNFGKVRKSELLARLPRRDT